jgi:hypothetical protein
MPKKVHIFDELMEGFRDAIARKKGRHVALRVTRLPLLKPRRSPKRKPSPATRSARLADTLD